MGAPSGERNGHCRIPDAVVVTMRDLYEHGNLTVPEIARRTGASVAAVRHIIYYRRRLFPACVPPEEASDDDA